MSTASSHDKQHAVFLIGALAHSGANREGGVASPPVHSVASGSEGGQNYISYDIENFKGRKKYQSVGLESSFRMVYCLLIFDDPVNLNVIYNSNIFNSPPGFSQGGPKQKLLYAVVINL